MIFIIDMPIYWGKLKKGFIYITASTSPILLIIKNLKTGVNIFTILYSGFLYSSN